MSEMKKRFIYCFDLHINERKFYYCEYVCVFTFSVNE